jgi:hypothetical protein
MAAQEDPQTPRQITVYNEVDNELYGTRASINVDGNLSAIDENSDWHNKELDHVFRGHDSSGGDYTQNMYRAYGDINGQLDTINFTQAGLNQQHTYESEFNYKIHFYRCILFIFCRDKTTRECRRRTSELILTSCPDVEGFYAWNWAGILTLPSPHDWDNDGLVTMEFNGIDPTIPIGTAMATVFRQLGDGYGWQAG